MAFRLHRQGPRRRTWPNWLPLTECAVEHDGTTWSGDASGQCSPVMCRRTSGQSGLRAGRSASRRQTNVSIRVTRLTAAVRLSMGHLVRQAAKHDEDPWMLLRDGLTTAADHLHHNHNLHPLRPELRLFPPVVESRRSSSYSSAAASLPTFLCLPLGTRSFPALSLLPNTRQLGASASLQASPITTTRPPI
jgi:hypothetical protein